ncbi:MAG TPA: class D sortase, partial [Bacteroidales bacterium]|nr:class D sortase [Bacteroidales bacterium]
WKQARELEALEEALEMITGENKKQSDVPFTEEQLKGVLELEIPSIELKQKVLTETTDENLNIALTQIKPNQTPGEGNFTIAGHRGYRGNRHFRNLPNVQKGDEILLHTKNQTFIYSIVDSKVIEPTDIAVLEDQEEKSEITLITCTISGKERIAVKGELKKVIKD